MKSFVVGRPIYYLVLVFVFIVGVVASATFFHFSDSKQDASNFRNNVISNSGSIGRSGVSDGESDELKTLATSVPQPEIDTLNEIVKLRGPLARNTALLNALNYADENQVLDMWEQSKQLDPQARTHTQELILQRLVQYDPTHAVTLAKEFNSPLSDYLMTAIFSEWAQLNLDDAVSHAVSLDRSERLAASEGILVERIDLSDRKRREIARRLGHEQFANNLINLERLTQSINKPEKVWNEIVKEAQNDPEQLETLIQIARIWVEKNGLSALDQIRTSLSNSETRSVISTAVLKKVAQKNPSEAFAYSLSLDIDPYHDSKLTVVKEWAKTDPQSALEAMATVSNEDVREALVESLVKTWAVFHTRTLLENLSSLPKELKDTATLEAISSIARRVPKEAAETVSSMEDGALKIKAARQVIDLWFLRDMEATLDWVLNDPDLEAQRSQLLNRVLVPLALHDVDRAMEVALEQPLDASDTGPEALIIHQLASTDIDRALEYMPAVRDGPTKSEAYSRIGSELIRQNQTEKALKLLQQIPDYCKDRYSGKVFTSWAVSDPIDLFNSIDQLPADDTKSKAALCLLLNDPNGEHLSEQQIKSTREFLTDDDANKLERLTTQIPVIRKPF
ncbi:MAG: hypothetical protein F4Z14_01605 [Gammaproteobacteria bacterium]|nr:hypothetical protein [Gammaproteobacteria bacterium]